MDDGVVLLADRYAPPDVGRGPDGARPLAVRPQRRVRLPVRAPDRRARPAGRSCRAFAARSARTGGASTCSTSATTGWRRCAGSGPAVAPRPRRHRRPELHGPRSVGDRRRGRRDGAIGHRPRSSAGWPMAGGSIALRPPLSWMLVLNDPGAAAGPAAAGARATPHAAQRSTTRHDRRARRAAFGAPVPYFREWMEEMSPDSPYWAARTSRRRSATSRPRAAHRRLVRHLPAVDGRGLPRPARGRSRPAADRRPWTHTAAGMTGVSLQRGRRLDARAPARRRADGPRRAGARLRHRRAGNGASCPTGRRRTRASARFYLQPAGGLSSSAPTAAAEPSRYRYDPADPTPALGGAMLLEQSPCATTARSRRAPTS